jgi:ATP synthase protein I
VKAVITIALATRSRQTATFLTHYFMLSIGPPGFAAQNAGDLLAEAPLIACMRNDPRDDREELPAADESFEARLRRAREQRRHSEAPAEEQPRTGADASALARGFRLSTELVAGVLMGGAIGWLLDRWLGISPWGMIVFLLLGFAAGVLNVMRAAGVIPKRTMPPASEE